MKKRTHIILYSLAILISFSFGLLFGSIKNLDIFYSRGDYSLPNTIIIEKQSVDGNFNAQILYEKKSKAYYFALQKKDGTRLVIDSDFIPHTGYHEPTFEINWGKNNKKVYINIIHDFGDCNLKFIFDVTKLKLNSVTE